MASPFQTRQVEPSLIVHLLERNRDVQAAQIQNNTDAICAIFSHPSHYIPKTKFKLSSSSQMISLKQFYSFLMFNFGNTSCRLNLKTASVVLLIIILTMESTLITVVLDYFHAQSNCIGDVLLFTSSNPKVIDSTLISIRFRLLLHFILYQPHPKNIRGILSHSISC